VFKTPAGSGDVVENVSGETMVIDSGADAFCCGFPESFTDMVGVVVPADPLGVPLITPVEALIDKPLGRFVADQM
jgi:hypothetical protein